MSAMVKFYTCGLLSKWGFLDGELLSDATDEVYSYDPETEKRALVAVVKHFVIPKIENAIELVEITTIHNPIRAVRVDGVNVNALWFSDLSDEQHSMIRPTCVEVPLHDIIAFLRENFSKPPSV